MDESQRERDPVVRFADVFQRAAQAQVYDHTAMVLSTAGANGRPSSRVVLLKEFGPDGFVFYTNRSSRKGAELRANPFASLCFYWPVIGEQVRIEGSVDLVSDVESDAYFASRPRMSQISAWASAQSQPLESRDALVERCRELEKQFPDTVPRPEHWGGYRLRPLEMEFWINGEFRLHDRFRYTRSADGAQWTMIRLNP